MSTSRRRIAVLAGLLVAAASSPLAAMTTSVVRVQLADEAEQGRLLGLEIVMDHQQLKAGRVTFQVSNNSKMLVHEMLVVRVGTTEIQLPYDPRDDRVMEDKMDHLGEVSDLQPGTRGTLTMVLRAGSYLLLCNQPGHFHAGMWTPFTVVP